MVPDDGAHTDIGVILYTAAAAKRGLGSDMDEVANMDVMVDLGPEIDDAVASDRSARANHGASQHNGPGVERCGRRDVG